MSRLKPDRHQRVARVLSELTLGVPVVLRQGDRTALVAAVETLTPERFVALHAIKRTRLVITERRARTLKAMVYYSGLARLYLPGDADFDWVRAMADPSRDLDHPFKGPFLPRRGGDAALEAAALDLCKKARLLPAVLALRDPDAALTDDLASLDIAEIASAAESLDHVVAARVPLDVAQATRVHIFGRATDFEEHYAIEIGTPDRAKPVLCRLHSACFTGDVLASRKCDCGAQLQAGLDRIAAEGAGILLYLNQEGRGIGLANKLRAYALQDQGFDTVEANHRLGFEDDERDLAVGAAILRQMGFSSVRLMTNNPAKVEGMTAAGIEVTERVPHRYGRHAGNEAYLDTKAGKSGHIL